MFLILLINACTFLYENKKIYPVSFKTRINPIVKGRLGVSIFKDERPPDEKKRKYHSKSFTGNTIFMTGTKSFMWFDEKNGNHMFMSMPNGFAHYLTYSMRYSHFFNEVILIDSLFDKNLESSDLIKIKQKYNIDYLILGSINHFSGFTCTQLGSMKRNIDRTRVQYSLQTFGKLDFLLELYDLNKIKQSNIKKPMWVYHNTEQQYQMKPFIGFSENYLINAAKKVLDYSVSNTLIKLESFLYDINENEIKELSSNKDICLVTKPVTIKIPGFVYQSFNTNFLAHSKKIQLPGKIIKVFIKENNDLSKNICGYGYKIVPNSDERECNIWVNFCDSKKMSSAVFNVTIAHKRDDYIIDKNISK